MPHISSWLHPSTNEPNYPIFDVLRHLNISSMSQNTGIFYFSSQSQREPNGIWGELGRQFGPSQEYSDHLTIASLNRTGIDCLHLVWHKNMLPKREFSNPTLLSFRGEAAFQSWWLHRSTTFHLSNNQGVSLSAPPSSVELSVPDPTSGVPPDQLAVTSRVRNSILSVCLSGVLTLVQKFAYRIALLLFHFASALSRRFHQSYHFY